MKPRLRIIFTSFLLIGLLFSVSACTDAGDTPSQFDETKGSMTTTTLAILQIVLAICMLVSLIALIIPGIPGITFIWLAALIYGIVTGFDKVSTTYMIIITVLMLLGNVIDNVLMGAGARKGGAPWLTTLISVLAAIIGSFAWPPFGGVIASALVLFVMEVIRLKDSKIALKSAGELIKGFGCSFIVRFLIGIVMIGLWIAWLVQSGQWLL